MWVHASEIVNDSTATPASTARYGQVAEASARRRARAISHAPMSNAGHSR